MFSLPAHIFDAYPVAVHKKKPVKGMRERRRWREKERERASEREKRALRARVKGTLRPYFGRELRIMRVLRAHRHKYIRGGSSELAAAGGELTP